MASAVQSDLQWEGETGELIEGYNGSAGIIGFIHRLMISEPSTVKLEGLFCLRRLVSVEVTDAPQTIAP